MVQQEILRQVSTFAEQAHEGQTRKYSPEPYIAHPRRVMQQCGRYSDSLPLLAAALLHDVLEDTPVTPQRLALFLSSVLPAADAVQTLQLVTELTDVYSKNAYPAWNRRQRKTKEQERLAATSPAAQTIKYADIIDNCDEIIMQDPDFAAVLLKEYDSLLRRMDRGIPALAQLARQKVHAGLSVLAART